MIMEHKKLYKSKVTFKLILEFAALLLLYIVLLNPVGLIATIALIHRVRVFRTTQSLLRKAITKDDKDKALEYKRKLIDLYVGLEVSNPRILSLLENTEEETVLEEKRTYTTNTIVEYKYASRDRSVLGIFLE